MTKQNTSTGTKPTHRLYRVEGEGKNACWTEIGAAWPNRDGNGFSIICGSRRVVMRRITERAATAGQ